MGKRCAALATAHPRLITLLGLITVLVALIPASRVGFDASVEGWFLPDDELLTRYQECRERFGNDEFLLVVADPTAGDVFNNEVLIPLRDIATTLEADSVVTRVHGIHNALVLRAVEDTISIDFALGDLPLDPAALHRARLDLLADPRAVGFVVQPDGARASLVVELNAADLEARLAFAERVQQMGATHESPELKIRIMGDVILHRDLYLKVQHDVRWILPLLMLVLVLVLAAAFRSPAAVVLCLGVVGSSVVGARALMGLLGWGDSPLLTLVPVVLVVTGVADAVHILDRYFAKRSSGDELGAALQHTLVELFRPCLFTSLTTAAGFLALTASSLFPLRQLGVLAAAGVAVSFVLSVLVLPAAIATFRPRGRSGGMLFSGLLTRAPLWIAQYRKWVLGGAALATVAGGIGMSHLKVESRYLETFHASDPIRKTAEWVEEEAGGLASLEVVVTADHEGGILDPRALSVVDTLAQVLNATTTVTDTRSLTDVLKLLNRAAHGGQVAAERVPSDAATAAQMLFLYETVAGEDLHAFVDLEHRHARIWARSRFASASLVDSAVASFDAVSVPEGMTAELSGALLLFRRMSAYIVSSQLRSFALALITVSLFLTLALRSWRLGLLSLLPNLWPLVLTLGFMGAVGWWLQPSTAMVAAIALGIGVDDTVHFLDRYQSARKQGLGPNEAVAVMMNRAGRAVTLTTVVLILGFAVALLSGLRESMLFAALTLIALALAWVGDVLVLPALLLRGTPKEAGPRDVARGDTSSGS